MTWPNWSKNNIKNLSCAAGVAGGGARCGECKSNLAVRQQALFQVQLALGAQALLVRDVGGAAHGLRGMGGGRRGRGHTAQMGCFGALLNLFCGG